jgi:hypothetical protein
MVFMTSGISYHIIADSAYTDSDHNKILKHLHVIQPRWVNVMGSNMRWGRVLDLAHRLKLELPTTRIILRYWPDDGNWTKAEYKDPRAWYAAFKQYMDMGFVMLTDNESVTDDMRPYAEWQAAIIRLALADNNAVAVGRFSTGTPDDGSQGHQHYPQLDPMWYALAESTAAQGAAGKESIWSPNEYYNKPDGSSAGHLQRYLNGWKRCDLEGVPRPTTVIGEYGMCIDYKSAQGYKLLGKTGRPAARMGIDHFNLWYRSQGVDVMWYAMGVWGIRGSFNVLDDPDFLAEVEDAYGRGEIVVKSNTKKLPMPKPKDARNPRRVKVTFRSPYRNLRDGAGQDYTDVGDVYSSNLMTMYEPFVTGTDGLRWAWVETAKGRNGWFQIEGVSFENVKDEPEKPADPPPIEQPPPTDPAPERKERRLEIVVTATDEEWAQMSILAESAVTALSKLAGLSEQVKVFLPRLVIHDMSQKEGAKI